jgi:hypothetical protein
MEPRQRILLALREASSRKPLLSSTRAKIAFQDDAACPLTSSNLATAPHESPAGSPDLMHPPVRARDLAARGQRVPLGLRLLNLLFEQAGARLKLGEQS